MKKYGLRGCVLLMGMSVAGVAQQTGSTPPPAAPPASAPFTLPEPYDVYKDPALMKTPPVPGDPMEQKRQAYIHSKQGMLERQRALTKAVNELMRLTAEVRQEAAKGQEIATRELMSQQLAKIERLARSVSEQMQGMR